MLFIHMAFILNGLFFPKGDPHIASLLTAFAFCSTYLFRPFGALIFGYIGDKFGRRITVIITTILMSFSCLVMANAPTYEKAGIMAAWIITICRIVQGMSSMGESVGAELYLTETVKVPARYPAVASIALFASFGAVAALGIASLVTSYGFNWRLAFWAGALVATIGMVARTRLRETPEFADAKRRLSNIVVRADLDPKFLENNSVWKEKVSMKTSISFLLMQCANPVAIYFAYIYCGNILQDILHCSAAEVIHQNFILSIINFVGSTTLVYLSYKIYPLKILKGLLLIFSCFILFCPYILNHITSRYTVLFVQVFVVLFFPSIFPAAPIFYKNFPVFKRFRYASFIYALSRALMYVITSFGLVYLVEHMGFYGMMVIMIPALVGFAYGLNHFIKIEKEKDRLNENIDLKLATENV